MTPVLAALAVVVLGHRLRPRARRWPAITTTGPPDFAARATRAAARAVGAARRRLVGRAEPSASAVAEWCGDLARAIRSGDALRTAVLRTVPGDAALRTATGPLRLGLRRGRSIDEVADSGVRSRHMPTGGDRDHVGLACSVVAVSGRLGGSAAAPLDRVAATLRLRAADQQERAAQAAQARLSAHVLTTVPLAVLGLLLVADQSVRSVLASPIGAGCVVGGVILNAAGWIWMRRIIDGGRR